jgi:esterase/lipase
MMKWKITFIILAAILILYLIGPSPTFTNPGTPLPKITDNPDQLENYIHEKEASPGLKPDNEARIIWFDSTRSKTPYSIIYLHGFRASQREGDPIHKSIAKAFGSNLYLNRLPEHGIDTTDAFINFTADKLWENVKESLAIGKAIGEKVIIISTSTGGTAALYLAANYPDDVYALINMSPNVGIKNPTAFLLNNHWGLQLAKLSTGSDYMEEPEDSVTINYWTPKYRIESLPHLEEFVEKTMTPETFSKVKAPSLTLYYYKSETEQDPTLSVDAMLRMHEQLATPDSLKFAVAIPTAGAHVIGSNLTSKDVGAVYNQIDDFFTNRLKIEKVK